MKCNENYSHKTLEWYRKSQHSSVFYVYVELCFRPRECVSESRGDFGCERGLDQEAKPEPLWWPCVCVCVCVCVFVRTGPNHLMNTEQHHSSEQDSQINQRASAFSPLIIPANHGLGKLTGDLAHWTVPAAIHGRARPIGRSRLPSQPPFRGAWERDLTD